MPIPRRFDRRPPDRDTTRINERIRVPKVRLIGADGEQVGIVDTDQARQMAREAELDLVEVAANAKPPVCRLLDYSKYKYEQEQKQKAARKHQTQVNIREIKLRPKIADNDYNTKKGHVERFLKHGDKVKVTIMFRGREQAHPERGRDLLYRLFEDLGEELAVIESRPLQEGRNMSMLLGPSKEATREAEARKQARKKAKGKNRGGEAPEVPDHPNAVAPDAVPDHPNAVAPDAIPDHPNAVAPDAEAPEPTEPEDPPAGPEAADEAAAPAEEPAETSD
ncbi:MAG TPA: translation initiation factor IF-3 [Solirubrobacterales bacterium]|nr:translation initiation factor IF-3 [Solirubrobacterales bacterium]